jgi:hypothetical protein
MAAPPKTNAVFRLHDGKVQPVPQELPALKPNEVLLRITHSGLCHSDTYYISSGMALGHEGVGVVEQVGSAVTTLKVGERAGGGYLRGVSQILHSVFWFWCWMNDGELILKRTQFSVFLYSPLPKTSAMHLKPLSYLPE